MFCHNCGKEVENGARFCDNCGLPVAPVQPVSDQTVFVPELPVTELPPEPSMDAATIIVPELPDTDVLPEPPAPVPAAAPKKNKTGLIIGLIAGGVLLVALTVIVCWFLFGNQNNTTEDKTTTVTTTTVAEKDPIGDDEPTADELRGQLTAYTLNGLTFYLSEAFEETNRIDNAVSFDTPLLSSSLQAWVFCGPLTELEMEAQTSQELADWLIQQETDGDYTSEVGERYGVSYVAQRGESGFSVLGCYVHNGYYWIIEVDSYTADDVLIDYATLGVVDENFVPSEPDEEVTEQEVSLSGLHMRLDSSFLLTDEGQQALVYENEYMGIYILQSSVSDFSGVTDSEAFAKLYLELQSPEDWQELYMDQVDGFHYVRMTDEDSWTTLVGMYVYEDWCWLITGETRDFATYGDALLDYMSSGWVVPEELPEMEVPDQTVEFADMKLQLPGSYKEIYRDDDYVFLSGEMEVYIFTGNVDALDGTFGSAEEMARAEQAMYEQYWDHADWYQVRNVSCLMLWDATETDSTSIAYGYYMAAGRWWMIEVKSKVLDTETMVGIVSSGVLEVEDEPAPPKQELVSRDRIEMTGQLTADYYGLQISYSPDWTVDTTWGPTGDYTGNDIEMYSYTYGLADQKVSNAIEFAWQLAEEWGARWDNCEVGLADGVPYVLLTDEESDNFIVMGTYANDTDCWEIDIYGYDMNLLEEAIWYATAGQITEGVSAT